MQNCKYYIVEQNRLYQTAAIYTPRGVYHINSITLF